MKKTLKIHLPYLFLILLNFCINQQIVNNHFVFLNHFNCELDRFFDYELFSHYDKNRICIYSLKNPLLRKINKSSILYKLEEREVITGLDISEISKFQYLKNIKFALFTNLTGVNYQLKSTLEILRENLLTPEILLEPEHGIFSSEDFLSDQILKIDKNLNIPILNLYSKIKKPPIEYLQNIHSILIDIQNLPVRCYTYISTLTYILEVADILQKEVIILDRPHPYGIWDSAGHFLEEEYVSFVGEAPVPFLFGLTPAEYSIYLSMYKFKNLKLKILRMENFDPRNINWTLANTWINPSPNIPNLESALIYVGMVFMEGLNLSVGRGTTKPFIYSGAPWIDNEIVLKELRKLNLKGVKFGLIEFYPSSSIYKNQRCKGIQIYPVSKEMDPIQIGYEYLRILNRLYPDKLVFLKSKNQYFIDKLWGSDSYRKALENDLSYNEFKQLWISESAYFDTIVKEFKIY
ncbi:MAG: exo-beta-N-acetylmuramidase NamZ domain-containing protein [Leptonema sp. (in: bacteria)]